MIQKDVIIVGGGMSGLTAAAYVARSGKNVLLLEKNNKCGGLVNSFVKDGFLFEGGARALLNAGIIFPMLRELQISLDFMPSPVSVGIEDKVIHVERMDDIAGYAAMLKATYPDDPAQVDRLITVVQRVMRDMEVLYGVENPLFRNFREDKGYFLRHYLPWFFKFAFTLYRIGHMRGPVEDFLAPILPNRALRDMVDQHFFRATPAFFALSYFYLYTDYLYPRGGVGQLAEKLTAKVLELGGEIQLKTRVARVDAAQRRLEDEQGNLYAYDDLIWAADLKTLYRVANFEGLPAPTQERIEQQKAAILASRGTDSVFQVYLAVDESPETFRRISHGHFFYTPSRAGLGETHRSELKAMLQNWAQVTRQDVLSWLDRFCALNTYEISIPVLKDPTAAPPGKTGVIISTLFEYDLVKKVLDDGWYQEFKTAVEERMIAVLAGSIYPGLDARVLFRLSATPITIADTVGSSEGAIVGWSFEQPIPVVNSMLRINETVKTPIPHVLQAGQWSYSPTGVPTAILTGRLAVDALPK
jgi:phytoene dehydrogenase-like protein